MANKDNRKINLRFNQSNKYSALSFKWIKDGTKKIETRAATNKYRHLHPGDRLVFICGGDKFEKTIKKVKCFDGISDILKTYRVRDIMPDRTSKKELEDAYFSYPGYGEKITKFGLVAFELK